MKDIIFSTAVELAREIRKKQVSALEVLEAHLAQIERHNAALNAIITLDADGARQRARAADEALARGELWGPLHGVPLTLKDVHSTAGMRTTAGFPPLAGYIPPADGTVAARLKAAGANLIGKTNVPPLAGDMQTQNPIFGRTNNPWNLERTPGGSSGGAAATLAAGLAPLDIGSDILGSARIPAHFCGVYGLKTTEHRVSVAGHIPDLPGSPRGVRIMGTIGPLARDIDDLELAFSIIAGADGYDTDVPPVPLKQQAPLPFQGLRIAWAPAFPGVPAAGDIRQAVERLAAEIARQGSRVEACLPEVNFIQQKALYFELLNDVMAVFQPQPEGAQPISMASYVTALHQRDAFIQAWEQFFAQWDALLCPVTMTTAFEHCPYGTPLQVDGQPAEYFDAVGYCGPFNLTGHPAIVLPLAKDPDGLPVGVQIVGRRWSEERLLAIAKTISTVTAGFERPTGY